MLVYVKGILDISKHFCQIKRQLNNEDRFFFLPFTFDIQQLQSETMPCLNLSTNVNLDGVDTSSILSEATSTVASIIGKPEAVR